MQDDFVRLLCHIDYLQGGTYLTLEFLGDVLGIAFVVGFLSPDAFDVFLSVDFLVMIILGGLGSVWGAVAGAAVVTVLNDSLAGLQIYRPLIFGAILIACMLFVPGGLAAMTRRQS